MEETHQNQANEKEIDIDIPVRKMSKVVNIEDQQREERRYAIAELLRAKGFWNIDRAVKKALAMKYQVHERTIYRDVDWVFGNYKFPTEREMQVQMDVASKLALNQAMDLLNSQKIDEALKLSASRTVAELVNKYILMAESFRMKEKVADKHEIKGQIATFNMQVIKNYDGEPKTNVRTDQETN